MQKILLVKTSSLGDLIHVMPAVTDLQRMLPNAELHWLVEEAFAPIPQWHPFVKKVHSCSIRRWRKTLFSRKTRKEIKALKSQLQREKFDLVIDAQGLIKSAWMVRWLDTRRVGYDRHSIKESLASRVYTDVVSVPRALPAVERNRRLFALALGYSVESMAEKFGLQIYPSKEFSIDVSSPYVVFMHGTVWESKIWPVSYWKKLAAELTAKGRIVYIPWGSETERLRACYIAEGTAARVLPKVALSDLAYLLQNATAVIGSDTGLSHVSAALGTKTIGLYGPTSVQLTGLLGEKAINLQSTKACSPCLKRTCPLIGGNDDIPCYKSIDVPVVLRELGDEVLAAP